MTQHFEDFQASHPEAVKTMELLGMSWQEYRQAWQRIYDPPRIYQSNSTTVADSAVSVSASTTSLQFESEATYDHTITIQKE
jgi:hypothetical protein